MSENIISWNFANWVTVCIMAFAGMAIVGAVSSSIRSRNNQEAQ